MSFIPRLETVTKPSTTPITLAEAKLHIKRDDITLDDTLIKDLIEAATELIEAEAWTQLITATYNLYRDDFANVMHIPRSPLQSVTSIKYFDDDNAEQTLAASNYDVDIRSEPGRILISSTGSWPNVFDKPNAVIILFKAGYGDTQESVPSAAKAAIKILVDHLYQNRDLAMGEKEIAWPDTVSNLVNKFTVKQFA